MGFRVKVEDTGGLGFRVKVEDTRGLGFRVKVVKVEERVEVSKV